MWEGARLEPALLLVRKRARVVGRVLELAAMDFHLGPALVPWLVADLVWFGAQSGCHIRINEKEFTGIGARPPREWYIQVHIGRHQHQLRFDAAQAGRGLERCHGGVQQCRFIAHVAPGIADKQIANQPLSVL